MKIIKQVKPNTDKYTMVELNCFEKPIGVAVDSYKKGFSHFYYLYIKMLQAYNIKTNKYKEFKHFPILVATTEILPELYGFELKTKDVNENLHEIIMNEIDNNHIVFLQGNLRELFYSTHYKDYDWNHLFLIKGYNATNNLYFINDSIHIQSENATYLNFTLPFEIISSMFQSFPFFQNKFINSLYVPDKYDANINLVAENFFKAYFKLIDINCLKEEIHLQALSCSSDDENDSNSKAADVGYELRQITTNKKVFLKELLLGVSLLTKEDEPLNIISDLTTRIISLWDIIVNKSVINAYSNRKNNVTDKVQLVKALEVELYKSLLSMYKELFSINTHETQQNCGFTSYNFYLENNEDSIINTNNTSINFNFNNGKLYDTWFDDNSPKIMFSCSSYNTHNVEFSAHVKLLKSSDFPYLMAGIVLRDINEKIYYFGLLNGVKIVLDLSGIDGNICNCIVNQRDLILKVILKERTCSVLYAFNADNPEFILIDTLELKDYIKEIGLGCKTWQEYEPLSIEFSKVNITTLL